MKLTNQRKGTALVLGLGVLALGVDRFVLRADASGPAAANASPIEAALDSSTPATAAPPSSTPQGPSLSDLLEKHRSGSGEIADAFAVPSSWVIADQVPHAESAPLELKDPLQELASQLKLTAVAPSRQGVASTALINGKTLIEGKETTVEVGNDSYLVMLISTNGHESAVIKFMRSGREVVLKRAAHSGSENHGRSSR